MAKMTRLEAFKGRERGQNDRRKREAVESAVKKVGEVLGWSDDIVKQAVHKDSDHFRFPRKRSA
jgi:hypothetical protein